MLNLVSRLASIASQTIIGYTVLREVNPSNTIWVLFYVAVACAVVNFLTEQKQ